MIGDVEIIMIEFRGDQAQLGVAAPCPLPVHRMEVYLSVHEENEAAAGTPSVPDVRVGHPLRLPLHTCPVRAYGAWLAKCGLTEGPLFRGVTRHGNLHPGRLSDRAVALIVKRAAQKAAPDLDKYGGHSLRAGLATNAAQAGVSERSIMARTGHKSVVVARRYLRDRSLSRDNAAAQVGLQVGLCYNP